MKTLFVTLLTLSSFLMTAQDNFRPTVEVSGVGTVNVVPDQVTINMRVERTGANAKEVKQQNDRVVSEVLQYLKSQGIDPKHVKSDYVRLSKNYEYNTKTYNYVANQSVTLKLVDLNKYETVMNGLLETGINRIDGISFSASNKKALESAARQKAVANAKKKAEEYAGVLNQSVGKALQISEFQRVSNPGPMLRSAMAMDAESGPQTLAPGEMEITVRVNVSFELN